MKQTTLFRTKITKVQLYQSIRLPFESIVLAFLDMGRIHARFVTNKPFLIIITTCKRNI